MAVSLVKVRPVTEVLGFTMHRGMVDALTADSMVAWFESAPNTYRVVRKWRGEVFTVVVYLVQCRMDHAPVAVYSMTTV